MPVTFQRYFILFATLVAFAANAQGPRRGSQVVDDSTRNVYGPQTTKWISEEDIYYNRNNYQPIDTSITNYHRWGYVQRFNNKYKDLGIVGTALYPVFPQLPSAIGVSTGFTAYDPYFQTEEPKYFDTKSPYTRMRIIWGGFGRAMTRIEFSRNISPRWNFGFNYRPILVDKQIQRRNKGDRQTVSHYYDIYTAYRSENDKYQVLVNYRRIKHSVEESGGVTVADPLIDSTYKSLFDPDNGPKLTEARSIHQRNQVHLFQQYKVGAALQVYHISDLGKQLNLFKDDLSIDPEEFYDFREVKDTLSENLVRDSTQFSYWANSIGVKGKFGRFFYDGYAKARHYTFGYKYLREDTLAIPLTNYEFYLGGRVSYEYDSLTHLTAWLEYLDGGNYSAEATLSSKWVDAKAKQMLSKPPFIYNAYRGSFDRWINDFKNVSSLQVEAFGKFSVGRFKLSPGFTFTAFKDYISFREGPSASAGQSVLPFQSSGSQRLVSPELRLDLRFFRHVHLRPQLIYSSLITNDDNLLRVPEIFTNTQLAYENDIFKKNLQVQIGVEVHWKSSYFDLGYDPAIQQFYLQDKVLTPSFPLTEVFINGKMKRGRFFFKYHNLLQAFTKSGYLPTPVYPGQRNIFDFGFELLLFD